MSTSLPTFKLESADAHVKAEISDTPSPAAISDTYMDDADVEDPDLDLSNANTPFWLTKLPRHLWETLSKAGDDNEIIELGTIRVEGPLRDPQRVSLRLNRDLPLFQPQKDSSDPTVERDFILQTTAKSNNPHRRVRYPGSTLLFSEKNLPGFKPRGNIWDAAEAESNFGQGRSNLFDETVRAAKRKETKGKVYTPYQRKPIPKITALVGTATEEFEVRPAKTGENRAVEARRVRAELDGARRMHVAEIKEHNRRLEHATIATAAERASMRKQEQLRRRQQKENRTARMDEESLMKAMLAAFREHRFWGLRDMRARVNQPEAFVKETLERIAVMHKSGDFNGRWELKAENKGDEGLRNAVGVAEKMEAEESDMDVDVDGEADIKSDESEDGEDFEDINV